MRLQRVRHDWAIALGITAFSPKFSWRAPFFRKLPLPFPMSLIWISLLCVPTHTILVSFKDSWQWPQVRNTFYIMTWCTSQHRHSFPRNWKAIVSPEFLHLYCCAMPTDIFWSVLFLFFLNAVCSLLNWFNDLPMGLNTQREKHCPLWTFINTLCSQYWHH